MPPCLLRPGFSFVEVLFAVIILGVGFIMIAAVFPVAIRQTQTTVDETSAAAIARAGANYIAQYATNTNMPSDGSPTSPGTMIGIPTLNNPTAFTFWQLIRNNIVSQDDPRYAYVSMYFRGGDYNTLTGKFNPHPYAQIVTICVQATESPTFTAADYFNSTTNTAAQRVNLQPKPVQINIANGGPGDVDLIGFKDSAQADALTPGHAYNAVAEGTFVVIRIDNANAANMGALIGSIYRVGARRADMDGASSVPSFKSTDTTTATATANFTGEQVWELMPGNDFSPVASYGTNPAVEAPAAASDEAWIVGRSAEPNTDPSTGQFGGPAMDVSAYSTFVSISQ